MPELPLPDMPQSCFRTCQPATRPFHKDLVCSCVFLQSTLGMPDYVWRTTVEVSHVNVEMHESKIPPSSCRLQGPLGCLWYLRDWTVRSSAYRVLGESVDCGRLVGGIHEKRKQDRVEMRIHLSVLLYAANACAYK